jgi:hypothetical protein
MTLFTRRSRPSPAPATPWPGVPDISIPSDDGAETALDSDLESVLGQIVPALDRQRPMLAEDEIPVVHPAPPDLDRAPSAAGQVEPGPDLEPEPDPAPPALRPAADPHSLALTERVRSTVLTLGTGREALAVAALGAEIERIATFVAMQTTALDGAQATSSALAAANRRLSEDNQRLAEENQQLRGLLQAILQAVEADRRHLGEAIGEIGQRVRTLGTSLRGEGTQETSARTR